MTRPDHAIQHRRGSLSRDRIIEAAMTMVDRDGSDGLSMRRLAAELGVEAMSLYNHVAGRDDILDAVAEGVLAGLAMPLDPALPWADRVRATGEAFRSAAATHPGSFRLVLTRQLGLGDGLRPTILGLHVLADA